MLVSLTLASPTIYTEPRLRRMRNKVETKSRTWLRRRTMQSCTCLICLPT
jgi:hypothetical protein